MNGRRQKKRGRKRASPADFVIVVNLAFAFSVLSLYLSLYILVVWVIFLLFRLPVLARFSVAKAFLAGRREEGSVKHQVVCAHTLVQFNFRSGDEFVEFLPSFFFFAAPFKRAAWYVSFGRSESGRLRWSS